MYKRLLGRTEVRALEAVPKIPRTHETTRSKTRGKIIREQICAAVGWAAVDRTRKYDKWELIQLFVRRNPSHHASDNG